jgi:hypothetical protein
MIFCLFQDYAILLLQKYTKHVFVPKLNFAANLLGMSCLTFSDSQSSTSRICGQYYKYMIVI